MDQDSRRRWAPKVRNRLLSTAYLVPALRASGTEDLASHASRTWLLTVGPPDLGAVPTSPRRFVNRTLESGHYNGTSLASRADQSWSAALTFHRAFDRALALMSENVSWPKASEGGRVVGKEEIRSHWTRQWKEFDPHVELFEVIDHEGGITEVKVHQLVKSLGPEENTSGGFGMAGGQVHIPTRLFLRP